MSILSSTPKQNQILAREINRQILNSTQVSFSFPSLPSSESAGQSSAQVALPLPLSYRARVQAMSDLDSDSESEPGRCDYDHSNNDNENDSDEDGEDDFSDDNQDLTVNSPDDVGRIVQARADKQKRRRNRALAKELKSNQGLCFFMRRRNAWTNAIRPDQVRKQLYSSDSKSVIPKESVSTSVAFASLSSSSSSSSPSSSKDEDAQNFATIFPSSISSTVPSSIPSSKPSSKPSSIASSSSSTTQIINNSLAPYFAAPSNPEELIDVLIPMVPELISPDNNIRKSIIARPDLELYDKLVLDGRTPVIPINLAHMVQVIVSGWKHHGNWPSSATTVSSSIVLQDTATVGRVKSPSSLPGSKHFRQGMESVKRALRLSGSGPPPGD